MSPFDAQSSGCRSGHSAGLSFAGISRVRRLVDLVLQPFVFNRTSHLGVDPSVLARKPNEIRLHSRNPRFGSQPWQSISMDLCLADNNPPTRPAPAW